MSFVMRKLSSNNSFIFCFYQLQFFYLFILGTVMPKRAVSSSLCLANISDVIRNCWNSLNSKYEGEVLGSQQT